MSEFEAVLPLPEADDAILRALIEAAPDGFLIVDQDGRIIRVNAQIERLFGYKRSELAGRRVELLVPADLRGGHLDQRRAYQAEPSIRRMGLGLNLFGRRKDGSEFPLEISLSPAQTTHGQYVVAIVRDITETVALEKERNALEIELETEQERQRIGMDLHDGIMQEIYATALTLELALEDIPEADEEGRKSVERAINQLHETTRNIRSYIFDLRPRQFTGDLPSAIEDLAREFQQNSQIRTAVALGPRLPDLDMETAVAFYQIVHESLSNVQKHAHATAVSILLRRSQRAFVVEITDDGVGFDAGAEVGQRHRGLRNMHTRCAAVGAEVRFVSRAGKGTTVSVELPLTHRALHEDAPAGDPATP